MDVLRVGLSAVTDAVLKRFLGLQKLYDTLMSSHLFLSFPAYADALQDVAELLAPHSVSKWATVNPAVH